MKKVFNFYFIVFLNIGFLGLLAQSNDTAQENHLVEKVNQLNQKIEEIKALADQNEEAKQEIISQYKKAISNYQEAQNFQKEFADIENLLKGASGKKEKLKNQLEKEGVSFEIFIAQYANLDIESYENEYRKFKQELSQSETELKEIEENLNQEKNRPTLLGEEIENIKKKLEEVESNINEANRNSQDFLVQANHEFEISKKEKLKKELILCEKELSSFDIRFSLTALNRDQLLKSIKENGDLLKKWEVHLLEKRKLEAEKSLEEIENAPKQAFLPDVIEEYTQETVELSKQYEDLLNSEGELAKNFNAFESQLKNISENLKSLKRRIEVSGFTNSNSLILKKQFLSLKDTREYKIAVSENWNNLSQITSLLIDIDEKKKNLDDDKEELKIALEKYILNISPTQQKTVNEDFKKIVDSRENILTQLHTGYGRYAKKLADFDLLTSSLIAATEDKNHYVSTQMLWVQDMDVFDGVSFSKSFSAVLSLISFENWQRAYEDFLIVFNAFSFFNWLIVFALLSPLFFRSKINRWIKDHDPNSILGSVKVLVFSIFGSLTFFPLVAFLYFQIYQMPKMGPFTLSISHSMVYAFSFLSFYLFMIDVTKEGGLAKIHFRWSEDLRKAIQRIVTFLAFVTLPCFFLIRFSTQFRTDASFQSLSQFVFIFIGLILTVQLAVFLKRKGNFWGILFKEYHKSKVLKFSKQISFLFCAVPLFLVGLSFMGFFYTALQFGRASILTILLIIGTIILYSLFKRWGELLRRNLSSEEKTYIEESQQPKEVKPVSIPLLEVKTRLDKMAQQFKGLLNAFLLFAFLFTLWLIWKGMIPSLDESLYFNLWSSSEADGVATNIVLKDLILALLIAVITFIGAKNFSGALEITVLRNLPIEPGIRYTITTILQYLITIIGIVTVLHVLGLRWSQIQWLLAALGVGLGFGLQEIVANFFSGLIILFERPMRVGDTVTVGNITGRVASIKIRATTIIDYDWKELVVPNKEFITSQLINWTLSEPITRIVISVGVAYGSDTKKSEEILLQVAKDNPKILDYPAPQVFFNEFGDNSLNFDLKVFVKEVETRFARVHELHMEIDKRFRDAGITIAFPQRDIHFDPKNPLKVEVTEMLNNKNKDKTR